MRGLVNDGGRGLWGRLIGTLGLLFTLVQRVRMACHAGNQARLRLRFGVRDDTPILGYGCGLERLIANRARFSSGKACFALTSGSSASPKRLLTPPGVCGSRSSCLPKPTPRACRAFGIRRRSLFVLSALTEDGSLTARLLAERKTPSALVLLQAPNRMQADPVFTALVARYGTTAARLLPADRLQSGGSVRHQPLDPVHLSGGGGGRLAPGARDRPSLLDRDPGTLPAAPART